MKRLYCTYQDGLLLGIWQCPDDRFYYHIVQVDVAEILSEEQLWKILDYALAFHNGNGAVDYFRDMVGRLVSPYNLQMLKQKAKEIIGKQK